MSSFPCPVPPLAKFRLKSWPQPDPETFQWDLDAKTVTLSEETFKELLEYSGTQPSGVYPGKMWKGKWTQGWFLLWFGIVEGKPNLCSNNSMRILVEVSSDK